MNIRHIAIIMDGNGRWAEKRGLSRIEGHRQGVKRVDEIIDAAVDLKLKALTLYVFSMENWKRPSREITALMELLAYYLRNDMKKLAKKNIVFRAVGNLERLPKNIRELLRKFEMMTAGNTGLSLVSALSYGSKEEILYAVRKIVKDGVSPGDISEETFERYLYTAGLPDPDLVIRTSGEMRLSNFLLWQSAYSELYFTETLWPDFGRKELISAIEDYRKRERRFGALPKVSHAG